MNVLKKLFAGLLIAIAAITIVFWILTQTINPEAIKNYINIQLTSLTHQQSKVTGPISWQLFPRPGIKVANLQIGDENSQAAYAARLDNLLFSLKITPLLRGEFVFNQLNVDGFKIYINPDVLSTPKGNNAESKTTTKTNLAEQFAIERFLLSNGQIIIRQNQKNIVFSALQIGAERFNLKEILFPLQFKTNLEYTENNERILKTHINFKGNTRLSSSLFTNPLLSLQNTAIDGQLSLNNFRLKNFKITKINAHIKSKPGVMLLNPLTINLYHGESVGDLLYEFASQKLVLNQTATNVDGGKLISDLLNKMLFKGSVDFSLHAQANLQEANWLNNLTGNGSLTIKNGVIGLIDLDRVINETSNKINALLGAEKPALTPILELGQFANPDFFKGSTHFDLLSFPYLIQNGKLKSNSLVLQTNTFQLKGEGVLDLINYHLDSHLFVKTSFADGKIEKIQQLLGGSFPLLISGPLTEPTILPDLSKINPLLLKETLKEPLKKIEKTLKTIFINK